jgi:aspartate kinase
MINVSDSVHQELGGKTRTFKRNVQVLKFGGTSVKNIGRIEHVCKIIQERSGTQSLIVVLSAMGDTTDYLIKLAKQCVAQPDERELDALMSTGEQISITLLAMMLRSKGLRARSLTASQVGIFTESVHKQARIVDIQTEKLVHAFDDNDVLVVAGFQGVTDQGDITTLGRGGSDTTALALAAAVGSEVCDIYTDVDGVFTADPNVVKGARLLERISYDELIEMARLGAQVIHPRAVELARVYKVRLRVRNTFKPDNQGTIIDGGEDMEVYRTVSGIVVDEDQATVMIREVPDKPGVAGEIMTALADKNIMVDMIMQTSYETTGLNSITFTVGKDDLSETLKILQEVKSRMGAKKVVSDPDIAKVSVIGPGIAMRPQIASLVFSTLGKNAINIKMIASSEKKLTCVISRSEAKKATQALHDAFELARPVSGPGKGPIN